MDNLETTDLYHASYLLLSGCKLMEVRCIPTGGELTCLMAFTGTELHAINTTWIAQEAVANLLSFRNAYNQITTHVRQAKRNFERRCKDGAL